MTKLTSEGHLDVGPRNEPGHSVPEEKSIASEWKREIRSTSILYINTNFSSNRALNVKF